MKNNKLFKIFNSSFGLLIFCLLVVGGSESLRADSVIRDVNDDPPSKSTILNLCNNTTSNLYVARVQLSGNQGWKSEGWTQVSPKNCRAVNIGSYQGNVFIYAYNEQNGTYGGGDAYFCVNNTDGFDFANSDARNCTGGNLKKVGMTKWRVNPGTNRYNFN